MSATTTRPLRVVTLPSSALSYASPCPADPVVQPARQRRCHRPFPQGGTRPLVDSPARPLTDQATGLLMESFDLDATEAAYMLSTWSHLCGAPAAEVAAAVLCAVGTGDSSGCDLRVV